MRGRMRRHWLAFWLGMPVVGAFLGFGLASKWVAAYTMGALGILVLARSALGRLLLILGMIVMTTALGYLGLSVPDGTSGANYLFMVIMIALTLVTVAANVLHPIAWTDEEERLVVRGPALLGVAAVRRRRRRPMRWAGPSWSVRSGSRCPSLPSPWSC